MSRFISRNTQVPGPESVRIAGLKEQFIPRCLDTLAPFFMAEGKGALVTDVDGNRFIDFTGGWGCLAVGHSHPRVVDAIRDQAGRYTHTDFAAIPYESFVQLGAQLAVRAPGSSEKQVSFFNSGAEAVENAVKIARYHTKRRAIVVFENAFHGRTLLTMTMTHKATPYKAGFGPFASDIYRLPMPNPYRNNMRIEDFYCIAFDGCAVNPLMREPSIQVDIEESRRYHTAVLRALAEANLTSHERLVAGVTIGVYGMFHDYAFANLPVEWDSPIHTSIKGPTIPS